MSTRLHATETAAMVLGQYEGLENADLAAISHGLIHQTFAVNGQRGRFVLQRVNAIFPREIHGSIDRITQQLLALGIPTPTLVPTRDGASFVETLSGEIWRVQSFVTGDTYEKVRDTEQARCIGHFLANWHRVASAHPGPELPVFRAIHETTTHLERLKQAIAAGKAHRNFAAVEQVAQSIFGRTAELAPLPPARLRVAHGDPKITNFILEKPTQVAALVDLDTVGPALFAHELGDALRSWCNPCPEDDLSAHCNLELHNAAVNGYQCGVNRPLSDQEAAGMLGGPEWIALELASRFATDALEERYFGWDAQRFASSSDHQLQRARAQLALLASFLSQRAARAETLQRACTS